MDIRVKTPYEKLPEYFNFSWDLFAGESVSSFVLTCVNEETGADSSGTIVASSSIFSTQRVLVVIQAGAEGETHKINCKATTSRGYVYERELTVKVQTVVTDDFSKQPTGGGFPFSVNFAHRIESGDSISSVDATIAKESDGSDTSATMLGTPVYVGTKVGVSVIGGIDGETYIMGVRIVTALGYKHEKILRMTVQEL